MFLYEAVTADKYELPVAVELSIKDLSKVTGVNELTIYKAIERGSKASSKCDFKFVRVKIGESIYE